jgi:hypothetical protein
MKLFPTIAIASALALGACTTAQVSETETYATQVLAGLSAVLSSPRIEADLGANLAKAQAALADANEANAVLTGAASSLVSATTQSAAQQISADTETVVALVDAIPGVPASVSTIVTALGVVVPVMLASVDIAMPSKATPSGMSLQQAQSILSHPAA